MWTITYFGLMSTCGMLYTLYMDQKARRLVASEQADLSDQLAVDQHRALPTD